MARPAPSLIGVRTGLGLLAAAVAWTVASAAISGGDALPVAGSYLAAGAAFAAARTAGRVARWIVPASVVLAAAGIVVAAPEAVYSAHPHRVPIGYVNAQAAFFVQAAIAAAMLGFTTRAAAAQAAAAGAAAAFAVVPFAGRSVGAAVLIAAVATATAFAPRLARRSGTLGAVVTAVVVATVLGTMVAGAVTEATGSPAAPAPVVRAVDARRLELWGEAVDIMAEHPLAGVGPGRFRAHAPTARADPDARWAHNGFLQQGAEQGAPGFLLLLVAFAWGIAATSAVPDPDRVSVLGALAVTALAVGSSFDYLLHFWPLPVTVAALAGAASSPAADGRPRTD